MAARRAGLGEEPSNRGLRNRDSREQRKECDKGKNNLFSDLKPDANDKERKGHTGETGQMKKIIRQRKALYLKKSGTQTALDVR